LRQRTHAVGPRLVARVSQSAETARRCDANDGLARDLESSLARRYAMSEVEAMYDDAEQAQRAIEVLRRDDDVEEVRYVVAPATQHLPLAETKARRGIVVGAAVGLGLGLLAAALIGWRVGEIVTGSAAWVLGLGTMLLGALAGGLAFALDRLSEQPSTSSGTIWLRTSTRRIGRLVARLHRLGARRVEVVDASELPELAPLRR
jgi:hypothetical protein